MVAPAGVFWGIAEIIGWSLAGYEVYSVADEIKNELDTFEADVEKAKAALAGMMLSMQNEIAKNIDEKAERVFLHKLTANDIKTQSEVTKKALGRRGEGGQEIIAAIQQKIPFREVISMVCAQADKTPILTLRKKKGVDIDPKDILHIKMEILKKLSLLTAEELGQLDKLDDFIMVRLKQLVTSLIFEFFDKMLNWASPLKAEACFGKPDDFADPLLAGGARLLRRGVEFNPFFPAPHGEGSISADLAIPDYRKEPLKKDNLFAVIEIKFKGDKITNEQFRKYNKLAEQCAKPKTDGATLPRTNGKSGVSKGCLVALFRYPEDVAVKAEDDKKSTKPEDGNQPTSKSTSKKPGKIGGR
jgi:hypothetical protein